MQTSSITKRGLAKLRPGRARNALLLLNWIIPPILILLAIGFQLGPAQWIYNNLGFSYHIVAETTVFALIGPILAAIVIYLFRLWLEERDTADLQAKLLAQIRQESERSRQLNDDALQILFASGIMIDTLKASHPTLPDEMVNKVEATEAELHTAVEQLRRHLLNSDAAIN